jgi:PKD repeat protein
MGKNFDNYRIDNKVITASLVLSAFFLVLMAFRYKNTKECPPVAFSFRTANKFDVAYEKEKVYFSSEVKYDANEWEWDFGDKTPVDKESGPYLSHEYAAPGDYIVRLTINGKCEHVQTIKIGKRQNNKNKLYLRPFWPPETLVAGRDYYFVDSTSGATKWSWYFGEDETNRNKQTVTYQFVEPGQYRVTLVVNGDLENGVAERLFTVVAPPKINSPAVPGPGGGGNQRPDINTNAPDDVPTINDATGKSLEQLVSEQSKVPSLGETSLKAYILDINGSGGSMLRKYLKNGSFSNCSIIFNGKSITIDQLQANIVEHAKNGKTLSAKQEVDGKENYIKVIDITAELERKRGLFGSKGRKYPF